MYIHSQIVKVIATTYDKGSGTAEDPGRRATAYYDLDGKFLFERDELNSAIEKDRELREKYPELFKPDSQSAFPTQPKIEIRANEGPTEIYIDGKRLEGVMSYSLEEDPLEDLNPILKLKMRNCKFDVSTTAIPLLPAPWKDFYQLKPECRGFTDIETLEKIREEKCPQDPSQS